MAPPMTTNSFPSDSAVRITIEGLFALQIDSTTRLAKFGVYDQAERHNFSIKIFERPKERDFCDPIESIPDFDPKITLENFPAGDLVIDAPSASSDLSLKLYEHRDLAASALAFKNIDERLPDLTDESDKMLDYRWIINFNDPKIRAGLFGLTGPVTLNPSIITRRVNIGHGVLYSANWQNRAITRAFKSVGPPPLNKHTRFANKVGVMIPFHPSINVVTLSHASSSSVNRQFLSLPITADSYYDIIVSNLCPDEGMPDPRKHSDFQFYYNVVNIPISQRIDLQSYSGQGSNRNPCDVAIVGGP